MADTFIWAPDFGCRAQYSPAKNGVHSVRFNDGYEQRLEVGLNTNPETWPLTFSKRTSAEALAIRDFLKTQKGVLAFNWTTPNGDAYLFKCQIFDVMNEKFNLQTVTATFEQVFES